MSTIAVAELEHGIAKSQRPEQDPIALMQFLVPFAVVDFDHRAAREYGRIRATLRSIGSPICPIDLLLTAQSLSQDPVMVTNNVREFGKVEGLRVENWVVV